MGEVPRMVWLLRFVAAQSGEQYKKKKLESKRRISQKQNLVPQAQSHLNPQSGRCCSPYFIKARKKRGEAPCLLAPPAKELLFMFQFVIISPFPVAPISISCQRTPAMLKINFNKRNAFLAILIALSAWMAFDLYFPRQTDLRAFDADEVARLDAEMWRSYYDREPVKLFFQLAELLRRQFDLPFLRSHLAAFQAAKAVPLATRRRRTPTTSSRPPEVLSRPCRITGSMT